MSPSRPNCVTCGYAVDWLRSCYASSWRLFKGRPDLLTRGYYYRVAPNTPHFPGPHYYGSRNWTTPEIVDPPLGESSQRHVYRTGALPVPFPENRVVGAADCFSNGDTPGSDLSGVPLPGGVDARCYSVPPDPPPALWLIASRVKRQPGDGFPVVTWPDLSVYGREASQTTLANAPTWSAASPPGPYVSHTVNQWHTLVTAFTLTADCAVYLVATGSRFLDVLTACYAVSPGANTPGLLVLDDGHVGGLAGGAYRLFSVPSSNNGVQRLYWVRRRGQLLDAGCNSSLLGTAGPFPPSPAVCLVPLVVAIATPPLPSLMAAELRVYDGSLSDQLHQVVLSSLAATYPLVPL